MKIIYKIIYNHFINSLLRPIAKIIFHLSGKKLMSISGILKLSYNEFNFKLQTNQTCSVTHDLFYNGTENYEFTILFEDLIKDSKVFFDVGANIGYFSVLGEKINSNLKTFSFEPSFGPSFFIEKNIKLNNLRNVKLIKKAVSHINGELLFHDVINTKYPWIVHNLNGSNSLQNQYGREKSKSYNVSVVTLETVINENNLTQLDFLKLDTECTEHLILESSLSVINKFEPIIICEVFDIIEKEVQNVLDQMNNYEIYQYRDNYIVKISNLFEASKDIEFRNFIFCPKNKTEKITKFLKA
jgi:FkbM family methyltransferase